ncbi:hypothetical protein BRARA_A03916 [Brassica rapa]|uniref:Peptidase M16 C-terminal domain-containing protein n=1 Tax=Brassica campestris TaxID=3711 RepID=A0A398AUD1_BRACM|nr:hypothetical protein BRARA_A03916 [Brassica rapa]
MAIKNLLTSALRSQRRLALNQATRASSSISALDSAATHSPPPPATPILMPYDHAAEITKEKLKRLENPDQRFLKYASPHPILASHNHILSSPETRVTTLPNGLRNSKFEEQRINRERDVILREMQEVITLSSESIMAFNTNYKDTGLFGVYAVAKADCLDDLSYAIMHEVTKLAFRVSDDDVTRARNQLKSSLLLHMDGTSPIAEDIGRQLLTYGRRIPTAELFARIDAVDASTVKRVANKYVYDKDIAISAIGPIQDLPDYNKFRRRTYFNRY